LLRGESFLTTLKGENNIKAFKEGLNEALKNKTISVRKSF
jgi:hypothetical protein